MRVTWPRPRSSAIDIDTFLEEHADALARGRYAVEAIVDRINGIQRRLRHAMDDTLAQLDLSWGEWVALDSTLRWAEPDHRRSPGDLGAQLELSSGAMTNRLEQLEQGRLRPPPARSGRSARGSRSSERTTAWPLLGAVGRRAGGKESDRRGCARRGRDGAAEPPAPAADDRARAPRGEDARRTRERRVRWAAVIDPRVDIGHVHLKVADLDRALGFCGTCSGSSSGAAWATRRRSSRPAATTTTSD